MKIIEFPTFRSKLNLPGIQVTKFDSNSDSEGNSWNEATFEPSTCFSFDVGEISVNMYRFEIDKATLDHLVNVVFLQYVDESGELKTSNLNRAIDEFSNTLFIMKDNGAVTFNPNLQGKFQKFTSSDGSNREIDGVIDFLRGGVDVDKDKYADNYYPVIPKTYKGLPLKENNTDLFFQNTGGNTADFFIKVINNTDKWFVGSNDDYVGLTLDKRFDYPNVPVTKFYREDLYTQYPTNWTIACLNDAPNEADITFELYQKTSTFEKNKLLDFKTIKVKKLLKEADNKRPLIGTIYPNSNVSLGFDDELKIKWTDVDSDDNATIAIALDPNVFIDTPLGADINLTPWEGEENHLWIATNLKEDDEGSNGNFTFKTKGWKAGQYSLWAVIWDGKNEPYYIRFNGIIGIGLKFDDIIPYRLINSIVGWFKESPKLDINTYDNIALNTTSYQVLSASNLKSANTENSKLLLSPAEENWKPLTSNGSIILNESINNLEDSLTTDWKINNSDWDKLISNNQDLEKHYIVLKITDDAGNTYITPDINSAYELKIDIHNPNVAILNPTDGQNLLSNTVDANWIADDLFNGIQLSGIDAIYVALDQSIDFIQLESTVTNYKFKNLNNGVHTIYLKAKDIAGNFSELKHVNFSINSTIQLPEIVTTNVSSISSTSAFCGGIVIDSKGVEIIEKGLCWSSTINPTISLSTKTKEGTGSGMFTSSIGGLETSKTYYVRAYATNSAGTSYGEDVKFTTLSCLAASSPESVTASPITINSGLSTTLQVNGGVLNDAPNWVWYTGNCGGTQVGTGTTLSVSPTSTTTYYVQATTCGSSTNCKSIKVNVMQPFIASSATDITQTGFIANWNTSATAMGYYLDVSTHNSFRSFVPGYNNKEVGNVTTSPVTGLATNTPYYYRVRAYNSDGTSSNSNDIAVSTLQDENSVVNFSISAISGCVPLTVNLKDLSTNNPDSWEWDINNDKIIDYTNQNPVHVFNASGSFSVKLTVSDNGVTSSKIISNIIVLPKPEKPGVTQIQDTLLLSSADDGNQWFRDGIAIAGETGRIFVANKTGKYQTIVTFQNGCSSESSDIVNVKITGVELIKNSKTIKIYPNPTSGIITIEGLPENEKIEIALYNMNSKLVKVHTSYSSLTTMDINDVVSGIYLLVINNWFEQAVKIIKK